MRKFSLILSSLVLALACQTLSSHATTTPATGGVTISLTTSGFQFTPHIGSLIPPTATGSNTSLPPQVFQAAVSVQNHSGRAHFLHNSRRNPVRVYRLRRGGHVVWDSLPAVLPQDILLGTLKPGNSYHSSVSVPLFVKGKPLKPGTYTLEASFFGSPVFSATTTFVVNNTIQIN